MQLLWTLGTEIVTVYTYSPTFFADYTAALLVQMRRRVQLLSSIAALKYLQHWANFWQSSVAPAPKKVSLLTTQQAEALSTFMFSMTSPVQRNICIYCFSDNPEHHPELVKFFLSMPCSQFYTRQHVSRKFSPLIYSGWHCILGTQSC
jgi:hypothetical protein